MQVLVVVFVNCTAGPGWRICLRQALVTEASDSKRPVPPAAPMQTSPAVTADFEEAYNPGAQHSYYPVLSHRLT
jgi:hypothetical protein